MLIAYLKFMSKFKVPKSQKEYNTYMEVILIHNIDDHIIWQTVLTSLYLLLYQFI